MKNFCTHLAFCVFASFIQAAIPTDTNVTLLKVKKVTVEDSVIVIVAEKSTTRITLLADDQDPSYKGETRDGKPVTTVQVLSNNATFTIKPDRYSKPGGVLENVWKSSLALARKLQESKDVGTVEIGFYAPEVVIKRHEITSVIGFGYLVAKRQ
ncbi:hypothetical protein [Prosthecobacter sp.]|uniref:hypothetical protein n=1 Tax=Prosthecobacter sp. TaxID=1965333 RepID=UPI002AB8FCA6|nr:hypothetical protein [Prosthecobacter sp.]MDZ4404903.1 hypothetical protein [Prosthecobacter sp.]